jgi:hypothetical protein
MSNVGFVTGRKQGLGNLLIEDVVSGGPGEGWAILTNIAALATQPGEDGDIVFVNSVRSPWEYFASAAQFPVDGITVVATVNGGNTRWVRQNWADAVWRLKRDIWYIDPAAGSDENDGLTAGTAIKTGAELYRRWGSQNLVTQSGSSANFGVNIHLLGNIVAPDSLSLDCRLDDSTEIFVYGKVTTVATSAGATAVTVENQATNTPWSMTDATVTAPKNSRVRWTAGAALNACAWIAKVSPGEVYRLSQPQLSNTASFGAQPTAKAISVGEAYVVETLSTVEWGVLNITQQNTDSSFTTFVFVSNVAISANGETSTRLNWGTNDVISTTLCFDQCQFLGPVQANGLFFSNCNWQDTAVFREECFIYGGLIAPTSPTLIEWQCSGEGDIGQDVLIQGSTGLLCSNDCVIGNVGIFDTVTGGISLAGDGLLVGPPGTGAATASFAYCLITGVVWGSGNAGVGVRIRSGCKAVLAALATPPTPTVTGTGGDFALGAGGEAVPYLTASNTYQATPVTETWAHFVAGTGGGGGFGANAHAPRIDAHLLTLA